MVESVFKKDGMRKVDAVASKIIRFMGYFSAVCLLVMALWSTVNVIYSKITLNSIPSTMDWIAYLLVPVVFLSVGMDIMASGMISVDLITDRFPLGLRKTIIAIGYLIGAVISAIMCQQQFSRMRTAFATHSKSSPLEKLAFPLWPFSLIMTIGLAVMTFTMVWYMMRYFVSDGFKDMRAASESEEIEEAVVHESTEIPEKDKEGGDET